MAIKEEQYDPGYEDAYGGAYAERGPEGGQTQSQTNGHCTFSSGENTGNLNLRVTSISCLQWCFSDFTSGILKVRRFVGWQSVQLCLKEDALFMLKFLESSIQTGVSGKQRHLPLSKVGLQIIISFIVD